jgi:hypothetical protein
MSTTGTHAPSPRRPRALKVRHSVPRKRVERSRCRAAHSPGGGFRAGAAAACPSAGRPGRARRWTAAAPAGSSTARLQ